jgi:transcription initiation factor TFIIIB Brf1 subunit/transcription initiation factor TFIIB
MKKSNRYNEDVAYRKAVDAYKSAQAIVRKWIDEGFLDDPKSNAVLKAAIIKAVGRGKSYTPKDEIMEMLQNGPVNELDLFKKYKFGQAEMKTMIRSWIRDVAPKDRVYVAYDEDDGDYYIFGEGEEAPNDWTGYLPKDD